MLKVSVIIPTYCPGKGLDRVISALDGQTMPPSGFESIFVDDGSTDDTLTRLHDLAAERPNMRVVSIPNSGWPSRPRNVGLDMASGDFVVFMDHDDYLYPSALQKAYDFGVANAADVVTGKEVKTSDWFSYWAVFQRDVVLPALKRPSNLGPWTTHKLFRREFLLANGIRFREGSRVLWEDVLVDIDVYCKTDRLAVLSSVPFYQWVHTPGKNHSGTFARDLTEYLAAVGVIYDHLLIVAAEDPEFIAFMKSYQYGLRILSALVGPAMLNRDRDRMDRVLNVLPDFLERYIPAELDDRQNPLNRARAHLLRTNRGHLLYPLAETDRGIRAVPTATDVHWDSDGELVVVCQARWEHADGTPLLLHKVGDRFFRVLPDDLTEALPKELREVTGQVKGAVANVAITNRRNKVGWPVPTTSDIIITDMENELVSVGWRATGRLNINSGGLGASLDEAVWDVTCRSGFMGYGSHLPINHRGARKVVLNNGRAATAYQTRTNRLGVDVGQTLCDLFADVPPNILGVTAQRLGPRRNLLKFPFAGIVTVGQTRFPCNVELTRSDGRWARSFSGHIVGDAGGARVEVEVAVPFGHYRVNIEDSKREKWWATWLFVTVNRVGQLNLDHRRPDRWGRLWDPERH